jgi:hypothetical protein
MGGLFRFKASMHGRYWPFSAPARVGGRGGFQGHSFHGKTLALDEAHRHRRHDDALEDMTQDVALPETVQPILGERRVVGNLVIEVEPTEPPVGKVKRHLLA